MSWHSILRSLSAVLLLIVAFYGGPDSPVVTPKVKPVIDIDSSAAFVLTDTGEESTVSTPYFFDSRVQEALKNNGYQWKRFDDSVDIESQEFLAEHWKSAYKKAIEDSNGKRPWLLIGNKEGGESISLPEQPEKIIELINRYGASE
jgi:hypothetical protein